MTISNRVKATFFMLLSAAAISFKQVFIGSVSHDVSLFEQLVVANITTALISYVLLKRKKVVHVLGNRRNWPILLFRSATGFVSMWLMFYATSRGNQGEVAILSKLSPFIVILCAMFFLNEKVKPYQVLSLVVAFAGALVTSDPRFTGISLPNLAAFGCSFFAGISYFLIGKLKNKEDSEVIVFFFAVFTTAVSAMFCIFDFSVPNCRDMLLLLAVSAFSAIGQLGLTIAYSLANASEVSVYNYFGIPCSMVLGYLILNQDVKASTLIGSILVIGSGIASFVGDGRQVEKKRRNPSNG